jgi:hypothetical protein
MFKKLALVMSLIVISLSVEAQQKIKGNITDGEFGGPLIGASVTIPSKPGVGTTTNFDGNYELNLDTGKTTIQISYISMKPQTFNIDVVSGVNITLNTTLKSNTQLEVVNVVAEIRKDSESGVLVAMKTSKSVSDGISSETFKRIGDSDLSGAMKRVTGVVVQDNKYVYVRGLGDRYTKTLLNNMELPGIDPDVNSVQMDMFPTSTLENVQVYKSFTPDMNGDFGGGLVNISTKKFPDEKTTQISVGASYIPSIHFNNDYILYDGGKTDWLGFDDGTRKLNISTLSEIPDESLADPKLESITRSFNKTLSTRKQTSYMNGSFGVNHGNKIKKGDNIFGYNIVLNYSNRHVFYKDFELNEYLIGEGETMDRQRTIIGDVGKNQVNWSDLLSGSWKRGEDVVSTTILYNQSGESTGSYRTNRDVEQNQSTLVENVLTYTQRSLGTFVLNGKHKVDGVGIEWGNSFSYSRVYDPDFRETRISITDGDTTLSTGNGAGIDRFWRNLNEYNESFRMDITVPIKKSKLKTGVLTTYKFRNFDVQSYKHRPRNLSDVSINPDWYLSDDNIWTPETRSGTYTIGNYQPTNTYKASQNIFAGYVMMSNTIFKKVDLVYGVRFEFTLMYYTGQNGDGTERYLNRNTMSDMGILPSVNIIYHLNNDMNFRVGYNRTLARPSFKEKSIASIYDPITKRTFIGNMDLEQVNIDNVDIRYEYFLGGRDMISISGFYKHFNGHIELVSFELQPDNMKPRNSGKSHVFGGELEIRKGLDKHTSSKFLSGFYFTTNFTMVHSMVDMSSVFVDNAGSTELDLRRENNDVPSRYRIMSGQSPYSVNAGISYNIKSIMTDITLSYNVQGDQLSIIGSGRVPDIYTKSFHSLNLNIIKDFGKHSRLTFGVNNLLNQSQVMVYKSNGYGDEVFRKFSPGMEFKLKYRF